MNFTDAGPVPARGDIAQQMFRYSAFTPDLVRPGSRVMHADGSPKWRVTPSPHGTYWAPGMKRGYQDCGAWTLPAHTPAERRKAAWLSAQFCVCTTVSLKKTLVGLTPIRQSDLMSAAMTEAAPRLGGLIEFYRSPARLAWTPTGLNVPDYALLAPLWRTRIGDAIGGKRDPRATMNALAAAQNQLLQRLADNGQLKRCAPRMNPPEDPAHWLARPGAPKPRRDDGKPPGRRIAFAALLAAWRDGRSGG